MIHSVSSGVGTYVVRKQGLPHGHKPLPPREIPLTRDQLVSSFAHRVIPNELWPIVPCLDVVDESSKKERYSRRAATNMMSGRRTGQNDSQGNTAGYRCPLELYDATFDRPFRPISTAYCGVFSESERFQSRPWAHQRMSISCH
jgi:hypothetical protein